MVAGDLRKETILGLRDDARAINAQVRGFQESTASVRKHLAGVGYIVDSAQFAYAIANGDALTAIESGAGMISSALGKIPMVGLATTAGSAIVEYQRFHAEAAISTMESTGHAAYIQELKRNAVIGAKMVEQWSQEYADGGCDKYYGAR